MTVRIRVVSSPVPPPHQFSLIPANVHAAMVGCIMDVNSSPDTTAYRVPIRRVVVALAKGNKPEAAKTLFAYTAKAYVEVVIPKDCCEAA